jgi:hypothetical protein
VHAIEQNGGIRTHSPPALLGMPNKAGGEGKPRAYSN